MIHLINEASLLNCEGVFIMQRRCTLVEDIRTLCHKCAQGIRNAGYVLKRTGEWEKTQCDKCNWQGFEYILKKRKA